MNRFTPEDDERIHAEYSRSLERYRKEKDIMLCITLYFNPRYWLWKPRIIYMPEIAEAHWLGWLFLRIDFHK